MGGGSEHAVAGWAGDVARTLQGPTIARTATVAIDGWSGRILGVTAATRRLLGFEPADVVDLVEHGVLARPDLDLLRDRVRATVRMPPAGESAESWSTTLRFHLPSGPEPIEVHVAHHRRPRLGVEVVWATLVRADDGDGPDHPAPPHGDQATRFTSILDREARVVALDPRARVIWDDLDAMIGVVTTAVVHPEDLARIVTQANAIFSGAIDHVDYTVRVAASDQRWVTLHLDNRRVDFGDDHYIVVDNRIVGHERRLIEPGRLSPRELVVVTALFDGLRPAQIAERSGIAIKTIRNQLASAYKKLGVSGQADLLATYHRPAS